MQIKSIVCLKSTCQGMVVTVYITRIISGDNQDDAVVEWLNCCYSEELVIFIRRLEHLLKALPS